MKMDFFAHFCIALLVILCRELCFVDCAEFSINGGQARSNGHQYVSIVVKFFCSSRLTALETGKMT